MGNVGMRFKVQCAAKEDIYREFVRVSEQYSLDAHGRIILEGSVCKIRTPDATAYGIVRGTREAPHWPEPTVALDERLRNILHIAIGEEIDIRFTKVGPWGQLCWAWEASDPAYRVAARLGLLSVVLGIVGFVLGLFSLKGAGT